MRPLLTLFPLLALSLGVLARPSGPRRVADIPAPAGCIRVELAPGSYASWLRNMPLKPDNTIRAHDGLEVESGFYRVLAVPALPLLFRDDLEQCADWCFRFWAEYHRDAGRLDRLYLLDYGGNRRPFPKSGKSYRSFLRWAMASANSHSLKRGCSPVVTSDLIPGDMLVQNRGGGIGHVSVVVDACRDSAGSRHYLMGYGYMPAQEFHIERADSAHGPEGWFTLEGYLAYLERHFDYGRPEPRRFR